MMPPTFNCGHPRSVENSIKGGATWARCRECNNERRRRERRDRRALAPQDETGIDDSAYVSLCNDFGGFPYGFGPSMPERAGRRA